MHAVTVCRGRDREDTLFARYGGEEFVLGLPSRTLAEAAALAERIRTALVESPMMTGIGPIAVTCSFGVVQAEDLKQDTLESLMRRADEALYVSKRCGRNRVSNTRCFWLRCPLSPAAIPECTDTKKPGCYAAGLFGVLGMLR
ncbi:hypothetical protein J31TS4_03860 [Paenibacillus sp. J31TS4]|nr:hypothetical protein J31TS4_03860 [Paenibacillus sp. J31TS4]